MEQALLWVDSLDFHFHCSSSFQRTVAVDGCNHYTKKVLILCSSNLLLQREHLRTEVDYTTDFASAQILHDDYQTAQDFHHDEGAFVEADQLARNY
jgi:hypothetical protein